LATTLATRGVNVQFGDHVPADVREPMSWSAAIVALVIALPVLIAGMVFYAQRVPAAAGNMATVMRPDPFPRAPRPKLPRVPQPNQPGESTELAGGPEGWQFQMVD